mgnify:CR=1 FL=1
MTTFIALLRAVNVGGRKVPMADLRALATKLGLKDVQSYIQSGNLVFTAGGSAAPLAAKLETALAAKFGFDVPVIVRTAEQWKAYLDNPFPTSPPNLLYLGLSKQPPAPDAATTILQRAKGGEQAKLVGDALWIAYPSGLGQSKITPAHIDKAVGSPTTARNVNTVRQLALLAGLTA